MVPKSSDKTQTKRVLIFSIAYDPFIGGAEVAIKQITNRISDMEFDMITSNISGGEKEFERIGNINVYRVSGFKTTFPIKAYLLACKLHRERGYDLIWSMMANYAGFAGLFFKWRFPRIKFLLTLQEGETIAQMKKRVRYFSFLHKKIFLKADLIQVISNYLASFAREMNPLARVELVPNGVDEKLFSKSMPEAVKELQAKLEKTPQSFFLVTTSRLSAKNAISDVIKALALLPQNVHFLIIGSGELEQHLIDQARLLVVDERVKFLGFVPYENIPVYLHASDIFIRPSLSEGFGNSFIEAMAAGLPVVATPVGGIVDFIKDGETGIFVEVGNAEDIAHKVKRLMEDKNLRDKLIANGKKMVAEKYDWNFIAQEMKTRVLAKV